MFHAPCVRGVGVVPSPDRSVRDCPPRGRAFHHACGARCPWRLCRSQATFEKKGGPASRRSLLADAVRDRWQIAGDGASEVDRRHNLVRRGCIRTTRTSGGLVRDLAVATSTDAPIAESGDPVARGCAAPKWPG